MSTLIVLLWCTENSLLELVLNSEVLYEKLQRNQNFFCLITDWKKIWIRIIKLEVKIRNICLKCFILLRRMFAQTIFSFWVRRCIACIVHYFFLNRLCFSNSSWQSRQSSLENQTMILWSIILSSPWIISSPSWKMNTQ